MIRQFEMVDLLLKRCFPLYNMDDVVFLLVCPKRIHSNVPVTDDLPVS